jgi:lipopolysaccharide assembly protein A
MKALAWLLKGIVFFVLFAFALNNQGPVTLHFFFGTQWQGPVVLVVLSTFVLGLLTGVLAMVPVWLAARRRANAQPTVNALGQPPAPPPL